MRVGLLAERPLPCFRSTWFGIQHKKVGRSARMDLILTFLLAWVLDFNVAKELNCTFQELERCTQYLNAVVQTEELALATTKEELTRVCRRLKFGIQCIDDHSNRCFSIVQRRIFQSVVSDSRRVIEGLCVPGELQEGYLLYAPCWKNVSTDERKCALQYKKLAHNHERRGNVDDNLKIHCCLLTEFVQCQREHVQEDCGTDAESFFHQHLERMSGSLIYEHCALFTYETGACSLNGCSMKNLSLLDFYLFFVIISMYFFQKYIL